MRVQSDVARHSTVEVVPRAAVLGRVPAWNVWPVRVGLAGWDALNPYLTDCEATADPPFESKLTE